ncbi:MAG TPA: tRNA (adenosine(37)-N6)-threonylcarbamoyltransferase complex ATPase subunit type 1 TsaE [Candidatus Saccharimonadales bacterium]|nr:tRNA (adenosine(37)-N6)-threonylcarbamoyltransferase complex ATPase subunit type 1 TsaE [Candidatus Saccharimonadales bacterium]
MSSAETEALGERLGANLRGGEVIELVSDLGGGKTTLTRGLARGAGSADKVGSPSFTLSREYKTAQFTIEHFDFYRLDEGGIVADELAEFIGDPAYVCVVEWGDVVQDVLPRYHLTVQLTRTGDDTRALTFDYPHELSYLLEGLV